MSLVSPSQANPGDELTAQLLNDPHNQIATVINGNLDDTNISGLSGTKIQAGTLPASASTTDANPETRMSEAMGNFVADGCVWSIVSGLNATMTAGVVYISGKRVVVNTIPSQTFVASRDTYVSVDNTGTVSIASAVANNAVSPALPANSIWLAIVVSGATITSINSGQIGATAPTVSSRVLNVSDTNGKLIYPTAIQKLVGSARITSNVGTTSTSPVLATGLTAAVDVPTGGRKLELVASGTLQSNAGSNNVEVSVWEGTVGSGTIVGSCIWTSPGANAVVPFCISKPWSSLGGLKTFNVSIVVSANTGLILTGASLTVKVA